MRYNYIFFYIFFVVCILGIGFVQPVSAAAGEPVDFLSDDFYEDEPADIEVNDPIEPFNRAMFQFNDKTYTYIFNPVAEGYSAVVPIDIRGIIDNFLETSRSRFVL